MWTAKLRIAADVGGAVLCLARRLRDRLMLRNRRPFPANGNPPAGPMPHLASIFHSSMKALLLSRRFS